MAQVTWRGRVAEELGWLRMLAGRLASADVADEAVQATLVKALRKPPRDRSSPRNWLSRGIRTTIVDQQRQAARRRAKGEPTDLEFEPGPEDDSAERADIAALVQEALAVLEAEDRQILRLHFHDCLSFAAIARKT